MVVCVLFLALLACQTKGPWGSGSPSPGRTGRPTSGHAGVDADAARETVSHHVAVDPAHRSTLVASDAAYRASFNRAGFTIAGSDTRAKVTWSFREVVRGGQRHVARSGQWRGVGNVARRSVAAGMTEEVTVRSGDVEWDLVLASAPPGSGALTVTADLAGLHGRAARDSGGWRLPVSGGASLRLGRMVVVDTTGKALFAALPSIHGARLAMRVPPRVLDGARYPLTLDPTVSPEHFVSGTPASDVQSSPATASDGTNSLVVWSDRRSGINYDIYGSRVSSTGSVLDPAGIPISTAAGDQIEPAAAFDGTNYLVVWQDSRSGFSSIYGTRITPGGSMLGPGSNPISKVPGEIATTPAVAFDGTNYLVVWVQNAQIWGNLVSTNGLPLSSVGFAISGSEASQLTPAVSFDGSNFLVAWTDYRNGAHPDIYGARVSPTGGLFDTADFAISNGPSDDAEPAMSFDGTNFFVVWADGRSNAGDIYGTRVSRAGVVLDPAGIQVSNGPAAEQRPTIAFDGTNYLATWQDLRHGPGLDIYARRVAKSGSVLDVADLAIATGASEQTAPAVVFSASSYLVTWYDSRTDSGDIFGARVSTAGAVLDPNGSLMSTGPASQVSPRVAFDGTNYLVVWQTFGGADTVRGHPGHAVGHRVGPRRDRRVRRVPLPTGTGRGVQRNHLPGGVGRRPDGGLKHLRRKSEQGGRRAGPRRHPVIDLFA